MIARTGVMLAVDVLVGAGNTNVITGNGISVVVGVIVEVADGVAESTGVPVPCEGDGEPEPVGFVLDN